MNRIASRFFRMWWLASVLLNVAVMAHSYGQDDKKKEEAKSPPEALNLFADAASFQNNAAFELAADEWENFLKKFPNDPLAIKARHYAGVCHLQLKRFDQAAKHFQAVLAGSDKFELAEDAALNLGWCQFSLGQANSESFPQAIETLNAYLKKYPQGKFLDQALFYLGEAHYALGDKGAAVSSYERLAKDLPKSNLRGDALYAWGVTLEELKKYDEAGAVYATYLKDFPQTELATEVRMRQGETLFQSGKLAEAQEVFREVAGKEGFASADHAVFRQADCAARQEKYVDAARLYAEVTTRFPNSAYLADATIAAGRCFYRADQAPDAVAWFQKVLDGKGKDVAEAAHWLARLHLKKHEAQPVVELVEKTLPQAGDSPFVVNLKMDQADALYELADWKAESIERYVAIATEYSQHELAPQALYNAAFTALELKRFPDALKHVATFREKFAKDRLAPDVSYVAAECALQQGDFAAARTAYEQLLQQHAKHSESGLWRVRLGLAFYLDKKYDEAIASLAKSLPELSSADHRAEAEFVIGASHFEQGRAGDAIQHLSGSLQAQPKWRQADETLIFLSRAQKGAGQLPEARATIEKMLAEFPGSKLLDQAQYRLGEYLDALGDYAGAVKAYEVVGAKYGESPLAPYASYGIGWSRLRAKDYPAATASFSQLLEKFPQHALAADALFARGMSRRQAGQFPEAIADMTTFLQGKPTPARQADALYERGLAEAAAKQFPAAIKSFSELLAAQKDYPQAANVTYELAWAHKNSGQNAEATAAFARLAQDYPNSPLFAESLYHVGEEQYLQKQFPEAIATFTKAVGKAEGEVAENVLHKLAWSHFRASQYEPALERFREQSQKFANGSLAADGLFMQAECLFKLKKYSEALPAFEASIKAPSKSPQMQALTYLHGGQSASQLEQWGVAVEMCGAVIEKFADSAYVPEALYERGWAKQNLKKHDEALADYDQAATRSRGEVGARARFMIGEIQFERQEHETAIKSFLRVMYGYGGENAPEAVKAWQGSAGFEAGRCAEVQIQGASDPRGKARFIQDAKTYYTFVAEKHPQHSLAVKAKERLAALAKLK